VSYIKHYRESLYQILLDPEQGRKYLKTALEHGSEQFLFFALHNIFEAILYDLELNQSLEIQEK
jgi:hypothetical protein